MIDLRKIFINPFKDRDISFSELLKYSARHLSRMVANNPGALLNTRITATTTALAGVESGVTDTATKDALRKGKTQVKESFREALPENIRKIHGAVVAAFGDPSPELTDCFPEGRNVFNKCRDEELNNKLGQLLACITPKAAQVGATAVSNTAGLLSTWTSIYAAQDVAMAQRTSTAESRDTAKANLQLQLFLNVLALAAAFPDQPDKCDVYCPQQYLHNPEATDDTPLPPLPPTPPGP